MLFKDYKEEDVWITGKIYLLASFGLQFSKSLSCSSPFSCTDPVYVQLFAPLADLTIISGRHKTQLLGSPGKRCVCRDQEPWAMSI